MKVGVVGASGYSGETLVKLLLDHPQVTLGAVTSRQHAGKPLAQVIPALRGADRGLRFVDSDAAALAASDIALVLPRAAARRRRRPTPGRSSPRARRSSTSAPISGSPISPPTPATTASIMRRNCWRRRASSCRNSPPPDWKQFPLIAAPGCYPTSVLAAAGAAAARRRGVARAHCGQFLQRRQRRRPEGRGDVSLCRAGGEHQGLRADEAPAPGGDRGATRAPHRGDDGHPVQSAPGADAARHRDDHHRARRARSRASRRSTPRGTRPTTAGRSSSCFPAARPPTRRTSPAPTASIFPRCSIRAPAIS